MPFSRVFLVAAALVLSVPSAASAATIQAAEATSYVGQSVTVEAIVSEVFTDPKSGTTFLDIGGTYPDQALTAVIFSQDAETFPGVGSLGGKTVAITGQVSLYKGRPEIVLRSVDQLRERAGLKNLNRTISGASA
jgi:DNA/RNA endonuclease YhcR with UshA esterase domain